MAELKELNELTVFIKDLTILIIQEARQHKNSPTEAVKEIILGLVSEKLRPEMLAAFQGLGDLPAEIKAADLGTWIGFGISQLMAIPEIIAAFTTEVHAV